jgi:hypothetical protein
MKQFKVKSSTLKKGSFCLFVPAMLFHTRLTAQPTGYSYGKSITIQGSQQHRCSLLKVPVQPAFNGNTISMKLPALANGVYFLNVYIKDTKHTRKLLIAQ